MTPPTPSDLDLSAYWLIPRRPVRRTLAVAGGVTLLLLLTHALWLPLLASVLVTSAPPPAAADAIVVLGGGSMGDRETTAARLYAAGTAPQVWTNGDSLGLPGMPDLTFAELSALELVAQGVPTGAITQIDTTDTTCAEAQAARQLAEQTGSTRLVVVTDPFHTRRAGWLFERVFAGSGVTVTTVAAEPSWFRAAGWWRDYRAAAVVVMEYVKFVHLALVAPCTYSGGE